MNNRRMARRKGAALVLGLGLLSACTTIQEMKVGALQVDAGAQSQRFSLVGTWSTTDVLCGTAKVRQTVQIEQHGVDLTGTKIIGDSCVPSGYVWFEGKLPGATLTTAGLPVTIAIQVYRGDEGDTSSIHPSSAMARIVSNNSIELQLEGSVVHVNRTQDVGTPPIGAGHGAVPGTGMQAGNGGTTQAGAPAAGSNALASCPGPIIPGATCDHVAQCGCAPDENCQVPDIATPPRCNPAGAKQEGERCGALTECAKGLLCTSKLCSPTCREDTDCKSGSCVPSVAHDTGKPLPGLATCQVACDITIPAECYKNPVPKTKACEPCGTGIVCLPHDDIAACEVSSFATLKQPSGSCTENSQCYGGGCLTDTCRKWCRTDVDCLNAKESCKVGYSLFAGPDDEIGLCLPAVMAVK